MIEHNHYGAEYGDGWPEINHWKQGATNTGKPT
jgi:hypothetical protein